MLCQELKKSIENDSVSHAYLIDSFDQAMEFVRALACKRVDFSLVEKGDKSHILTSDIEELQEELKFKPYGSVRVALIKDAALMMPQAQNKLLKTLEEPFPGTVIILQTQNFSELLPTVLSRCLKITTGDGSQGSEKAVQVLAKDYLNLFDSNTAFFRMKKCLSGLEDRDALQSFLNALEDEIEKKLINNPNIKYKKLLDLVEEIGKNIRQGFSVSYAVKALCLGGRQ